MPILGAGMLWVAFGGMTATGLAHAQITPRGNDVIAHHVVTGDTLETLAARYLGDHMRWTALQSHNKVEDPLRLRPGSVLEIPTRLLRAAMASVVFVQGDVQSTRSVSHLADSVNAPPQPVQKGQLLQEGDSLQVPANAFVSVRLADGSLVRVQSESDVELRQMRRKGRAGTLQSVIDLREGAIEAKVSRQTNGERRFEVRTPAASTSVRGTQFLVMSDDEGRTAAAVDEGSVAVQTGQPSALLRPGQGLSVSANGQIGRPTAMLEAPDIAAWPSLVEDASWVSLPLPAMAGAVRYQVLLAQDRELTQIVRGGMFTRSPARLTGVEDGSYIAAIRAIDANGIPGKRSLQALRIKAHPVPPLYESPAPEATIGQGQQGLQCTQVAEASAYRIQVAAADGSFAQPLIDANDLKDCALPAEALARLPVGEYLWRVGSIRTLGNGQPDAGPFAPPQKMKLALAPKSPELQIGGAPGEGSSHIHWAGEEGQRYRIVVASDAGFTAPLIDIWVTQPQWSTQDLPPGTYYLQMQVEDANGLRSNLSAARQFQTGNWVTSSEGQTMTSGDGSRLMRQ
ncbi:FecR family protein [Comamonas testosteroni]|nr:FecR domain-containing protein [Comamonas testosteroni]EHN66539.1 peptidoglycan-binding LysM [Comamonas testosteroni ATCC 11996]QQN70228.1 FecR domain-containing protein [Comamonas testosteroni]